MIRAKQVTPDELERLMERGWVPEYDTCLVLRALNKRCRTCIMQVFLLDRALGHAVLHGKQVWCTLSVSFRHDNLGGRCTHTNKFDGEYSSAVRACAAWERYTKENGDD